MKNTILFLLLLCLTKISAQEEGPTLVFSYDGAGNLTERKVQVFALGRYAKPLLETDSISLPLLNRVSPNPAFSTLTVETIQKHTIQADAKIELVNLAGQLLVSIPYKGEDKHTLDVSSIKSGLYLLIIYYSSNDREVHKIIIND
jgi:hypothetical protein